MYDDDQAAFELQCHEILVGIISVLKAKIIRIKNATTHLQYKLNRKINYYSLTKILQTPVENKNRLKDMRTLRA